MNRTLSLLPSATEIIYELGCESFLVGVTHECDYPEGALLKPRVTGARINPAMESAEIDALVRQQLEDTGSLYTLDMELVRQLRPQLVLTQQLCTVCAVGYSTVRAAMRSLEEPPEVINLEPKNLEGVLGTIIEVGELLGVPGPSPAAQRRPRAEHRSGPVTARSVADPLQVARATVAGVRATRRQFEAISARMRRLTGGL